MGLVDEDGSIREVGSALSPAARTLLASDALILSPSEPSGDLGGRYQPPDLVAVTAGVGRIQAVLNLSRGGLRVLETGGCATESGICYAAARQGVPAADSPNEAGLAAPPAALADQSPTVAVYAASLETVFRVRGGGSPEVASHPVLGGGAWSTTVPRAGALGRVVAATYHVFDNSLWVLDEIGQGWGRSFRLLRVSPFGGSVEEIARFPRTGVFDSHWLVSDHDGRILVAASSSLLRRHALVKVRLDDAENGHRLQVEDAYAAPGELLAPPRVSAIDLSLVVQRTPQSVPTRTSHFRFPGEHGNWAHLGGCF